MIRPRQGVRIQGHKAAGRPPQRRISSPETPLLASQCLVTCCFLCRVVWTGQATAFPAVHALPASSPRPSTLQAHVPSALTHQGPSASLSYLHGVGPSQPSGPGLNVTFTGVTPTSSPSEPPCPPPFLPFTSHLTRCTLGYWFTCRKDSEYDRTGLKTVTPQDLSTASSPEPGKVTLFVKGSLRT